MKNQYDNIKNIEGKECENVEAEEFSFELTRAEFLKPDERKEIGNKSEGLVAIEKASHSLPTVKLHFIGEKGIVNFIKEIEKEKL